MGSAKERMLEEYTRGYRSSDKYVCDQCVTDSAIRKFISENACNERCDYCGREDRNNISARVEEVVGLIVQGILTEWNAPDAELPFETAEGGYQGETMYTSELISEVEPVSDCEALLSDIRDIVVNEIWCKEDYFSLSRDEVLKAGWQTFSRLVKHESRYMFFREHELHPHVDHESITPAVFLDLVFHEIRGLHLERLIPKGDLIYRCRVVNKGQKLSNACEFGPPPPSRARSSRMSPAGISVFYGALDPETSSAEQLNHTEDRANKVMYVAPFEMLQDLLLLDLSAIPFIPSLYDSHRRKLRYVLKFMHWFVANISMPVTPDDQEHIAYYPTQVVAEYVRHLYKDHRESRVSGILFPSSVNPPGTCVVLFCDSSACCDHRDESSTAMLLLRMDSLEITNL